MYGFSSYYWEPDGLNADDLHALRTLDDVTPELPSAGYVTRDQEGLLAAYTVLLRSGDARARGIALDQYHYSEAQRRWGQDNPLTAYDDEVLAQARAFLALPQDTPDGVAAWSSALAALCHLGEGSDLPRLMDVLDVVVAEPDEFESYLAFWAVYRCLLDADEATCRRIGARLVALATDDTLEADLRTGALRPFHDERIASCLGQEPALVALLDDADIRVSIDAAWTLVSRPDHQPRVRRTVAAWPDDAPYPSHEVRRALDELDQPD